jgi:hypothetical protein
MRKMRDMMKPWERRIIMVLSADEEEEEEPVLGWLLAIGVLTSVEEGEAPPEVGSAAAARKGLVEDPPVPWVRSRLKLL